MKFRSKSHPPSSVSERCGWSSTISTSTRRRTPAYQAIAPKLGVRVQSLRVGTWQALVDADKASGVSNAEQQRIKDLEREVRDMKEANEILKAASSFVARELDPRRR